MNFRLPGVPWFNSSGKDVAIRATISSVATLEKQPMQEKKGLDVKLWTWSLLSLVPWALRGKEKLRKPTIINRDLKRHGQVRGRTRSSGLSTTQLRFRPYVSKVPWHTGPRAFLSQLFPRYGHYCGPNWSSGKDGGSQLWDRRPIDWLDYCCYCHDIGYDTHDQAELLKADLAFLECLQSQQHMSTKGDAHIAQMYKTMCRTGLKNILIPYRQSLVKIQSGQKVFDLEWLSSVIRAWRVQIPGSSRVWGQQKNSQLRDWR